MVLTGGFYQGVLVIVIGVDYLPIGETKKVQIMPKKGGNNISCKPKEHKKGFQLLTIMSKTSGRAPVHVRGLLSRLPRLIAVRAGIVEPAGQRRGPRSSPWYVHSVCVEVVKWQLAHTGYVHSVCAEAVKWQLAHTGYVHSVCAEAVKWQLAHTGYVHSVCAEVVKRRLAHTYYKKTAPSGAAVVSQRGIEPPAHGLGNRCSIP